MHMYNTLWQYLKRIPLTKITTVNNLQKFTERHMVLQRTTMAEQAVMSLSWATQKNLHDHDYMQGYNHTKL